MHIHAINESKGQVLAQNVRIASSLFARMKGLLGTDTLCAGEALWITPCRSVHTLFMRYPIDVLFLNSECAVVAGSTLAPWALSHWKRQAFSVLELPAGTLQKTHTVTGDRISIKPV